MELSTQRSLRDDLVQFELQLEATAAAGRPSLWVNRLREHVRSVRERLDTSTPKGNLLASRR